MTGTYFSGLPVMFRLMLRRHWVYWLIWLVALAGLMPLVVAQYDTILPPGTDPRATLEPLANNPSMLAILGPAYDVYTKGGFVFWRVGGFVSFFAGMMAAFGVINATRAEEEVGRWELLRSGQIGRHTGLLSGVLVGLMGSTLVGVLSGILVAASGLPVTGSIASGVAIAVVGWVFTGIAAMLCQVFESARSVRLWAVGVLWGGMFVVRMMVDGSAGQMPSWVRWLLPIEWGVLMRPFAGERWWVVALAAGITVLATVVALTLEARRDHRSGLVRPRPGRSDAAPYLRDVWGLAVRLQRVGLVSWSVGLLLAAAGMGSIMAQMDEALAQNPQLGDILEKLGGSDNTQLAFFVGMLTILATVTAIMAAAVLQRIRAEETSGHAELLLSTATSRTSLVLSHLVWAVILPSIVLVGCGVALPLVQAQSGDEWGLLGDYAGAGAAYIPGNLLVVGIMMFLIGWLPRFTGVVWVLVGWSLFTNWFAVLFDLPQWLLNLNPWGHLPHLPVDDIQWAPVLVQTALAFALMALGVWGYTRRNLPR